jgi:glyoxylase-like metal-dependent hydrolase (beta-lactamase superfamily II)
MAKFKIYPLNVGRTIRDKSIGPTYTKDAGLLLDTPIISWYITDGQQEIIVDTGGVPADGKVKMPYYQEKGHTISEQLARLDIQPARIKTVIITHLHWDHMSNNHLFPNAKFYVQKKELQYAVAPIPIHVGHFDLKQIFLTRYEIVDGDQEIIAGISVLLTPGHTPGSQTVLVTTSKGIYGIAGDFVANYEGWESKPRLPGGIHTDLVEYYASFEKLERACDYVLPGHDYKVFDCECYPI